MTATGLASPDCGWWRQSVRPWVCVAVSSSTQAGGPYWVVVVGWVVAGVSTTFGMMAGIGA